MRVRGAARGLASLALAALALPALLRAEPRYVIEQLVVNVMSAPDASGERIATLKSGDRVEMLEREGDAVHVRLASGREGWLRASYLSAEEPLRVRLAQREADVARLNGEVSALQAQVREPKAAGPATDAPAAGAAVAAAAHPASDDAAAGAPGALFSAGEERARPAWPWLLAAALIAFGAGFGLGALMLDRHIRRKYGGLRIY